MNEVQLFAGSGDDVNTTWYTPWMQRQADNVRLTFEIVTGGIGSPALTVDVRHKSVDDISPTGTSAGSSWSSSGNFRMQTISGLKELFRFQITLTGSNTGNLVEMMYLRFLEPTWFNAGPGGAIPG